MRPRPMRLAALAAVALAAASLAACGGSSKPTASSSAGAPVTGGTLRFVASGDFDHIDPLSAYSTTDVQIQQAWTRKLVSFPASNNFQTAITVGPDIATAVPTKANGGLSQDGLTYTFHLRSDAMWNTNPPRVSSSGCATRCSASAARATSSP